MQPGGGMAEASGGETRGAKALEGALVFASHTPLCPVGGRIQVAYAIPPTPSRNEGFDVRPIRPRCLGCTSDASGLFVGISWYASRAVLGPLGVFLGPLGGLLEPPGNLLGASWDLLGPSWGLLGPPRGGKLDF